jgi:hypothetical protein
VLRTTDDDAPRDGEDKEVTSDRERQSALGPLEAA